MVVCPNCKHQNPEGATQCEACYTPLPTTSSLPSTTSCPNCGSSVQKDATFCGQCGFNLIGKGTPELEATVGPSFPDIPDLEPIQQLVPPDPLIANPQPQPSPIAATIVSPPEQNIVEVESNVSASPVVPVTPSTPQSQTPVGTGNAKTQLQQQKTRLFHVQTNTTIELPQNLLLIHIGKPNDQIPPDVDVSGFPNSEVVSRIHADIRVEGDAYYIEDVGSANGTYINHTPLSPGNRHRLRSGDRISLGKGDLVTFLFQLS